MLAALEAADGVQDHLPSRVQQRRAFLRRIAATEPIPIDLELWIQYRMWVDERTPSALSFHWHVCERTLGLSNPSSLNTSWTAGDASDLLAALAGAGLLLSEEDGEVVESGHGGRPPSRAIAAWLERMIHDFERSMDLRQAAFTGQLALLQPHLDDPLRSAVDEQLPGTELPPCGETALHLAASGGHAEAVALLIERQADVNATTFSGWSALHFAARSSQSEYIVSLLLSRHADARLTTASQRHTALHVAAAYGRLETIALLVAEGVDLLACTDDDLTALELARRRLLDCPCRADASSTLLLDGVVSPNLRWGPVIALLEKLGGQHGCEEQRASAQRAWELHIASKLSVAAEQGDTATLSRLLMCCEKHVNARDHDGSNALHAAALAGRANVVALLTQRDADVAARTNLAETPLHFAAREGHLSTARLLVQLGANVRAENTNGATPHVLARRHRLREWEAIASMLSD